LAVTLAALSSAGWAAPDAAVLPALHRDQFRVIYEEPKNPVHEALYEELKSKRVLENLREFLSMIRLPRILMLRLAGCNGDDDAWYSPEDGTVTVCYEYVEEVRKLAPETATPAGVTPENAVLVRWRRCSCTKSGTRSSISCAFRSWAMKRMRLTSSPRSFSCT
jgi:hypothetical protein